MASLRKLTELSPLFLHTTGASWVTEGDLWIRGLGAASSKLMSF